MNGWEGIERVLVVAPHPDDEVLGCGGTIARLTAQGARVDVVIATKGRIADFGAERVAAVEAEAGAAHARLGVAETHWLDFPAARLDGEPHAAMNQALGALVAALRPQLLFIPFVGDVHLDHQLVFLSSLVAARPRGTDSPAAIYAYETLSETNWNAPYLSPAFAPNIFVDISDFLAAKLDAFRLFRSQVQPFPHERSPEAIEALARLRGATVCKHAAEAFVLVRGVI